MRRRGSDIEGMSRHGFVIPFKLHDDPVPEKGPFGKLIEQLRKHPRIAIGALFTVSAGAALTSSDVREAIRNALGV